MAAHTATVESSVATGTLLANDRLCIRTTRHGLIAHYQRDWSIGLALAEYGEHDWRDLELTRQYARGLVIDAGANIGTHALVYAQTAEKVLAFEPQFFIYKLLIMNTVLNNADNVIPYWCALGAENGMVRIPSFSPDSEQIYGGTDVGEGDDLVRMCTVDSLQVGRVSFLKVDVERSMLSVLSGAQETVLRDRPVMYVENNFGEEVSQKLYALLQAWNYRWTEYSVPAFPCENFYRNAKDIFKPGIHNVNLLCFPKEA